MIRVEKGDLLNKKYTIFCHQVNCKGVMGSGIAKQIKNKYPEVYEEYISVEKPILGFIQPVFTRDGRICINMFAQDGYGRDKRYTDYTAFKNCLTALKGFINDHHVKAEVPVAFPYMIGCGLGGGDWYLIYGILKDFAKTINNDVVVAYKE